MYDLNTQSKLFRALSLAILLVGFTACGGSDGNGSSGQADATAGEQGLTQAQIEKGIGPVENVALTEEIEQDLAAEGQEIFEMKCTACHKMDQRYVGPPLGDVTERRTPEFIMNMMLNPEDMVQQHPVVQDLLAEYMTPMPNQSLTRDEARAILEYLRSASVDSGGTAGN